MCKGYRTLHIGFCILSKSFGRLVTAPNSFSINPRPTRVRFARESERIQIEASNLTEDQDQMFNECFNPTSPMPDDSDLNMDNDLANTSAASGFDYLPRGPAKSLILKCTNPDQLEIGSCYF